MPRRAWLLLPVLTLCWGLNWPVMKVGLSEFPVFTFRAGTALIGAAGLFLIARAQGHSLYVPTGQRKALLIASVLNMVLWNVLMLYGVMLMDSGRAAILGYTMPLWAAVIGMIALRERVTGRQALGLVSGLCGMTVLIAGDAQRIGDAPLGALLIIVAACSWGAGTVALKYFRLTLPTPVLTGWQQLVGAVPALLLALIFDAVEVRSFSLLPVLAFAYNAVVASIFCYWAWFAIVAITPVIIATVGTLMIPVVGVVSGALLLGERPGADTLAALVLVLAAIAAVVFPARPAKRRPVRA